MNSFLINKDTLFRGRNRKDTYGVRKGDAKVAKPACRQAGFITTTQKKAKTPAAFRKEPPLYQRSLRKSEAFFAFLNFCG